MKRLNSSKTKKSRSDLNSSSDEKINRGVNLILTGGKKKEKNLIDVKFNKVFSLFNKEIPIKFNFSFNLKNKT